MQIMLDCCLMVKVVIVAPVAAHMLGVAVT